MNPRREQGARYLLVKPRVSRRHLRDFMITFSRIPPSFPLPLGLIIALYVLTAEAAKRVFYTRVHL
jgi:hypothetical protein